MKSLHASGSWGAVVLALALPCLGCATTGKSIARVTDRAGEVVPVRMAWRTPSAYGAFGHVVIELPDGTLYRGDYRLVGEPDEMTSALWRPWRTGWPDWPLPWEGEALPVTVSLDEGSLQDRYRGIAIANLEAPNGQRMRCRFGLLQPTVGLAGGFDGDCQAMPPDRPTAPRQPSTRALL